MVSRENRVLLASLALVALLVVGIVVTGIGQNSPVVGLVVFVGVGVLLPQLYLAATDDDIAPASRIRTALFLTALFAFGWSGQATGTEQTAMQAIGALLLLALGVYEARAGYLSSMREGAA